ncbi:MAG: virulence-associated E family protein [Eubacteriales bacterium]|nr:virulence-associated E family protein [Eubacteriales bacterium]
MKINTDPDIMDCFEIISEMNLAQICATVPAIYAELSTELQKEQLKGICLSRAGAIGSDAPKTVRNIFASLESVKKKKQARLRALDNPSWLELNGYGAPLNSLNNYISILRNDPHFRSVRFNLMNNSAEIHETELGVTTTRLWCDADEAESLRYIEETYGIYSDDKHRKALQMLFRDREYNPVLNLMDQLPKWDGEERMSLFLHRWMGVEDSPYSREVSRLIFAGGIHRLYEPGCKFDEVPVLIGTRQGEGKSTIIRFLAMKDAFYSEVTLFEGKESVEQLSGGWICEISEMLAMTKTKETEAVKAFCSRQVDKLRKPYAKVPEEFPRRCIFIGTTNNRRFLKDKTGNRRFYPVECSMNGYDLYEKERECREYIRNCWAEARDKYMNGKLTPFADRSLIEECLAAQNEATEDDWREDAIRAFLARKSAGDRVCVRQLMREALTMPNDTPRDPTRKESHEIGLIMDKMEGWKRMKNISYIDPKYPKSRGWMKVPEDPVSFSGQWTELPEDDALSPF